MRNFIIHIENYQSMNIQFLIEMKEILKFKKTMEITNSVIFKWGRNFFVQSPLHSATKATQNIFLLDLNDSSEYRIADRLQVSGNPQEVNADTDHDNPADFFDNAGPASKSAECLQKAGKRSCQDDRNSPPESVNKQ
jgi:hypothetical protein